MTPPFCHVEIGVSRIYLPGKESSENKSRWSKNKLHMCSSSLSQHKATSTACSSWQNYSVYLEFTSPSSTRSIINSACAASPMLKLVSLSSQDSALKPYLMVSPLKFLVHLTSSEICCMQLEQSSSPNSGKCWFHQVA